MEELSLKYRCQGRAKHHNDAHRLQVEIEPLRDDKLRVLSSRVRFHVTQIRSKKTRAVTHGADDGGALQRCGEMRVNRR